MRSGLGLLLGAWMGLAPALAAEPPPVVTTPAGALRGTVEDGVRVFRGIPYAAPPVGALRWRAPQPAQPWEGVRDASRSGPACLQKMAAQEPERSLKDGPQGEDCLTLNIWLPPQAEGPLPVMVWIHGGSFRFGAGSLALYDGAHLARQGVAVVTLNYRLGLFGTFAHPALAEPGEPGGNYGLLDAIAALRWVRENIAAFGGDPGTVTLFGESAGGVSVGYLMASPLARGLFHRAIMQSGGLDLPEYDRPQAEAVAQRLATAWGAADAAALRALPATALRDAPTSAAETMPFLDGAVVPARARDAFEAGQAAPVPLLTGSNDAEAGFFPPPFWRGLPAELGAERWAKLRPLCFGHGAASEDACAGQLASERFAGVNNRRLMRGAAAHAPATAPVYAYRFAWVPPAARGTVPGAIHTAEIPYVFGHVAADPAADAASRALSRDLSARWVAFARSGQPGPGWPAFRPGGEEHLLLITPEGTAPGANPAAALLDGLAALSLPAKP
ncbi:carboxylesterase family protein [Roseomonas sp. GC11]|uniref:carboxylesterase/lipase family protein n=1 Tax=Roseomonas sp. GC11 TaxID=2950546 RepID=UPI00210E9B37|nr:carboxylesterase family protein [Roseomonas sp. GC11]MCQ4158422.1 carboxylesterase family protein [Roseomonas sp. GC11]